MMKERSSIGCRIRNAFSWLLLLGAIILGVLLGLGMLNSPSAAAAIRQIEEAPGQIVYQARQTVNDQHGNTWQAIAFQRVRPDGTTSFDLRLVGFPGMAEIDHTQPLTITNSLGKSFTATDTSSNIFADAAQSEPNVGQYNLQALLSELPAEIPAKLSVPTLSGDAVSLSVSPSSIQEWRSILKDKETG